MKKRWRIFKTFHARLIITTLLFFSLIVAALALIAARQYSVFAARQNSVTTSVALEGAESRIETLLDNCAKTSADLMSQSAVDDYILRRYVTALEQVYARQRLISETRKALSQSEGLYGVMFLRDDGTLVGVTKERGLFYESEAHPLAADPRFTAPLMQPDITWVGSAALKEFFQSPSSAFSDKIVFCGVKRVTYLFSTKESASVTAILLVDERAICRAFDYLAGDGERMYLLDARLRQVAGGVPDSYEQVPSFLMEHTLPDETEGSMSLTDMLTGEKDQVMYRRMRTGGLTLIKCTSLKLYNMDVEQLQRAICWMSLGVLMVIGLAYTLWLRSFSKSFRVIGKALESMRAGDLSQRMPKSSDIYEFELVRVQFNQMAESIESLVRHTRDIEHEKLELELRNLQIQLNPHMIFNSITAIRWMATFLGAGEVSDMLIELAELLHPIFGEWKLDWTLEEELKYASHYMKLLRLRYGACLEENIEVPDSLLSVRLPRFTLQPILENSCEHGATSSRTIRVRLDGMVDGGDVVLRVTDNGRGMSQEMLRSLRGKLDGTLEDSVAFGRGSIGLYNVHRRVQLLCGEGYGLSIESEEGEGTRVTVRLQYADNGQSKDSLDYFTLPRTDKK